MDLWLPPNVTSQSIGLSTSLYTTFYQTFLAIQAAISPADMWPGCDQPPMHGKYQNKMGGNESDWR